VPTQQISGNQNTYLHTKYDEKIYPLSHAQGYFWPDQAIAGTVVSTGSLNSY
jgi:hypothetical protein